MSYKWLKQSGKRHKIVTIKELANRYNKHRNTISKYCKDTDMYNFWSVKELVDRLERLF